MDLDGKWQESTCTDLKPFICKKRNSYCPVPWEYKWSKTIATYADAMIECRQWKGDLASINGPEEEAAIKKLHPNKRQSWYAAWIGLNDRKGKFVWTDGTGSNYRNWAF